MLVWCIRYVHRISYLFSDPSVQNLERLEMEKCKFKNEDTLIETIGKYSKCSNQIEDCQPFTNERDRCNGEVLFSGEESEKLWSLDH